MSILAQDTIVISPSTVNKIESEIEELRGATDCADVVANKAALDAYDTSKLTDQSIVKVLQDESKNNAQTYYRYNKSSDSFTLIGELGPYYTKSESDEIEEQIRSDFADADSALQDNIDIVSGNLDTHIADISNPHSVTKAQVGLGNVDNTSDMNKPVSTAQQTALDTKVDKVNTANRIYGTNAQGAQTTYDKEDFGKVDDVQVNGVSVVTNKIANVIVPDPLPSQSGNAGKVLTTDGTNASWESTSMSPATPPTLVAANWSSNTQTITVQGVTATNTIIVSPIPTDAEDYAASGILCTGQATNALTFTCQTTPVSDLQVNIVIM